tara:strand:- start:98 stop:601 length:504 start_codon:yes stop_codon:yes gene_type:complete
MYSKKIRESLVDDICTEMGLTGKSLRRVLKENPHFPSMKTVLHWIRKYDYGDMFTEAARNRADHIFEDMLAIAENQEEDFIQLENGKVIVNHNHIQRAKLRIDVRKYMVGILNPMKYSTQAGRPSEKPQLPQQTVLNLGSGINPEDTDGEITSETGARGLLPQGPSD